jgi:hypothetical protein
MDTFVMHLPSSILLAGLCSLEDMLDTTMRDLPVEWFPARLLHFPCQHAFSCYPEELFVSILIVCCLYQPEIPDE